MALLLFPVEKRKQRKQRGHKMSEYLIRKAVRAKIQKDFFSSEENLLRHTIRRKLVESNQKIHQSTGINVLEDLLKQIIPEVEEGFMKLTSNKEQRESFRAHLIRGVENEIKTDNIVPDTVTGDIDLGVDGLDSLSEAIGDQVKVSIATDPTKGPTGDSEGLPDDSDGSSEDGSKLDDRDGFIDVNDGDPEEAEENNFMIAGLDETGRNMAYTCFTNIKAKIEDSLGILSDPSDKQVFEEFLIKNLNMYMDMWEDQILPERGQNSKPQANTSQKPL